MKIIPKRKKKDEQHPVLALKVHVVQTRHVGLIDTFQCNPICYVSTDTFYTARTSKLKHSNTKWNQILKIKLPRNPNSELLRIIVFDALPTLAPNTTTSPMTSNNISSSTTSLPLVASTTKNNHLALPSPTSSASSSSINIARRNSTANVNNTNHPYRHENNEHSTSVDHLTLSQNNHYTEHSPPDIYKRHITSKYLYIGEVQLSLLDLFKKKDATNSYNFSVKHDWYTLYDRKREKEEHNSGNNQLFPVGEIQLSFNMTCNMKNWTTFQAYNQWQTKLVNTKISDNHKVKKEDTHKMKRALSVSDPRLTTLMEENAIESPSSNTSDDDEDLHLFTASMNSFASFEQESNHNIEDIVTHDEIDVESLIETFDLLAQVGSTPDEDEDLDILDYNPDNQSSMRSIDINSIATVLDEYDVVLPEDAEASVITNINDILNSDMLIEEGNYENVESDDNGYLIQNDSTLRIVGSDASLYNSEIEDEPETEDESDEEQRLIFRPKIKRLLRVRRNSKSYKEKVSRKVETTFQVSKKQHSLGVVFTEFVSIKGLPHLKNKVSRRSYDMDPFIIASFGRRVFKTSWKKHTLNPIYNENAAFEVFPHEKNFSFHFKVMDKDAFSYNDKIAEYDLPWTAMITRFSSNKEIWTDFKLPLNLLVKSKSTDIEKPIMHLRMKFIPYARLKKTFWRQAVMRGTMKEHFDMCDLLMFLDKLGSFTDRDVLEFFSKFDKRAWAGDVITKEQLIDGLQSWKKSAEFKNVWRCPKCFKSRNKGNNILKSKLMVENDLITHLSICVFSHTNRTLKPSYVSSAFASRRWFTKFLIKLTYGKYALGSNNANILVQDRDSGIIIEEKISAHVKVGMRLIYNGKGTETKRFKTLLKNMSVKQGKKFDNPASVRQIESFIKFHSLDMSQCLDTDYKTFNEFFYRKLKPGSRIMEGSSPNIMVSPADSRCTVFNTIQKSKELWIKGTKFSIQKLTNNYPLDGLNDKTTSIAIFRLAPQDYHRFHSPCSGTIGKPIYVDGEYYTVNPMAIRSELDVFGENIRVILPIHSPGFGTFLFILVGAMMVGSIILTCQEGEKVEHGQEVGYFKFGGSTIIMVVPQNQISFDSDLAKISSDGIETLVKVGMSVGHTPDTKEYKRKPVRSVTPHLLEKIKRNISVSDETVNKFHNVSWEYQELEKFISQDYNESNDIELKDSASSESLSPRD